MRHPDRSVTDKELKRSQRRFGFLNNSGKRLLLVHGQIGKNFTINLNIRLLQASNQTAVRQAISTGTRIDTRNPQSAERTLTVTTVTVRVLTSFNNRLLGYTEYTATSTVITFGLTENLFVTTASHHTTFYTSHILSPDPNLKVGQHANNQRFISFVKLSHAAQVTLTLGALFGQDMATERFTMLKTVRSLFEALGSATLGFDFWHFGTPISNDAHRNQRPVQRLPLNPP
jgi:hypothetical protein